MKTLNYLTCIVFLLLSFQIYSQDKKILVFDPNGVSQSFLSSFMQLTNDSIFVADTIDENINNFDALFLFIDFPYALSQEEGTRLIQYTSETKPVYIFSDLYSEELDSVSFWNHIGVNEIQGLLIAVMVDSVRGIDTTFTKGVSIDTSFTSWSVPIVNGSVLPILSAWWSGSEFYTTYISGYDSLNVVVDLYNLIDDIDLLRKVLEHFELIPVNDVNEQFISSNKFLLDQNYPNPFNPSTTIKFMISDLGFTKLTIFDLLGNEIETLFNEELSAGEYEVEFDGNGFPSGIYFYQLSAGNFIQTRKMILLK